MEWLEVRFFVGKTKTLMYHYRNETLYGDWQSLKEVRRFAQVFYCYYRYLYHYHCELFSSRLGLRLVLYLSFGRLRLCIRICLRALSDCDWSGSGSGILNLRCVKITQNDDVGTFAAGCSCTLRDSDVILSTINSYRRHVGGILRFNSVVS